MGVLDYTAPTSPAFGAIPTGGQNGQPFPQMPAPTPPPAPAPAAPGQLDEPSRTKLDGIVSQMQQNQESDANIQAVVDDFKQKYSAPAPFSPRIGSAGQPLDSAPGETLGGDLVKVAGKVTNALGFGKTADTIATDISRATNKNSAAQNPAPSAMDQAGAALNIGSTLFPLGAAEKLGAGVLGKAVGPTVAKYGAKAIAGGLAGYANDAAHNLESGQAPTPGAGTAIGLALPAAGLLKSGVKAVSGDMAPRIINSLIKPLQKDFAYGKNPGRTISDLGITASSLEDLGTKVTLARQEVGQAIGQIGDSLEGKGELKLQSSLKPLDDAIETAVAQRNQAAVTRLQEAKKALSETSGLDASGKITSTGTKLLDNATFKTARGMLGQIGDMTQFTGNPSDDKLVNSALKQVYGKVKEQTLTAAEQANPEVAAQFRKLTEQYGDLSSAKIAIDHRGKIEQRSNMIGLSPTIAGAGAAATAAIATGGAAIPAILAGAAGAGVDKALGSTAFKTNAASLLSKVGKPAAEKAFSAPGDMLLSGIKNGVSKKGSATVGTLAALGGASAVAAAPLIPSTTTATNPTAKPAPKTVLPTQKSANIEAPVTKVRGLPVTQPDLDTLRKVLFAEISNRDTSKQKLEAQTITNTALNRLAAGHGGAKTLKDVLTAPKQYQGYGSKEYQRIDSGKTGPEDKQKLAAIDAIIEQLKSGKLSDNISGMQFYTHNKEGRITATSTF